MKTLYHGSGRKGLRYLVPGPNNLYGLGVYFSCDIQEARDYGRHIYVVKVNSHLPIKKVGNTIHILRGGLEIKEVKRYKDVEKDAIIHICRIKKVLSLEEASKISERDVLELDTPQSIGDRLSYSDREPNSPIEEAQFDENLSWNDPKPPTPIDWVFGKVLGIALATGEWVRRKILHREPLYYLQWLAHYYIGRGRPLYIESDKGKEIFFNSRYVVVNSTYICRVEPSNQWFKTIGTYHINGNTGSLFDLYKFGRQPGQVFSPGAIAYGGDYPLVWATSAFLVKPWIGKIVKLLSKVSRAVRDNVVVHEYEKSTIILISNGFWNALGGRPFITKGYVKSAKSDGDE